MNTLHQMLARLRGRRMMAALAFAAVLVLATFEPAQVRAAQADFQEPDVPVCGAPMTHVPRVLKAEIEPEFEACGLGWAFADTIPQVYRNYIHQFLDDVCEPLEAVMGAPSDPITVFVDWDPNFRSGGNFFNDTNTIVMKYMPIPPDTTGFNFMFLHEVTHAFQDAPMDLGDLAIGWPAEGIAVFVVEMVKLQTFRDFGYFTYWSLPTLSRLYDSCSQMGGDALAGGEWLFGESVSSFFSYGASGGFWWILSAAQSDAAAGQWADYDYLRQFNEALYASGRPMTNDGVLKTIEETAPRPVDGLDAKTWAERQPCTDTSAPPGRYLFATFSGGSSGLAYQPFERLADGTITRLYDLPVRLRVWRLTDSAGTPFVDRQLIPQYGGDYYVYELVSELTHGVYTVDLDPSAYGAQPVRLVVTRMPEDSSNEAAQSGVVLGFFDTGRQFAVRPTLTFSGATIDEEYSGALQVMPNQVATVPCSFNITARNGGLTTRTARHVPLPYRRFMRINVAGTAIYEKAGPAIARQQNAITVAADQLTFRADGDGHATLALYDVTGRRVEVLFESLVRNGGTYAVALGGKSRSAGVYFLQLDLDGRSWTQRLVVTH